MIDDSTEGMYDTCKPCTIILETVASIVRESDPQHFGPGIGKPCSDAGSL
eukprot:m.103721 g.103721  ORF g.103721 m.103721 type:complete len:50 (-) comp20887_c0_seq1:467-616(-)